MNNALNGDRLNSNEEANEVIKMYKQVSIFSVFLSLEVLISPRC